MSEFQCVSRVAIKTRLVRAAYYQMGLSIWRGVHAFSNSAWVRVLMARQFGGPFLYVIFE